MTTVMLTASLLAWLLSSVGPTRAATPAPGTVDPQAPTPTNTATPAPGTVDPQAPTPTNTATPAPGTIDPQAPTSKDTATPAPSTAPSNVPNGPGAAHPSSSPPVATPLRPRAGSTTGTKPTPSTGDTSRPSTGETITVDDTASDGLRRPVLDAGLDCGLRVLIAQDISLPVAAVALIVEQGTEHDPPQSPGLTGALAYHLQQGNRELRPSGALERVHESGGFAAMFVGPAQVRFESLVPVSRLDDVLWIESQRLRSPTVNEALWLQSVRRAEQLPAPALRAPREAVAAAYGNPGLLREGKPDTRLTELSMDALSNALAQRFRYSRATLLVVSPLPASAVFERAARVFADLPTTPRESMPSHVQPTTRAVTMPKNTFVWAIPRDPGASLLADALCRAMREQRGDASEPKRMRLACAVDHDPRRAALTLRVTGTPEASSALRARLERLFATDYELLVRAWEWHTRVVARQTHTPLGLVRWLAHVPPLFEAGAAPRSVEQLLGVEHGLPARGEVPAWLAIDNAIISANEATAP